MPKAICKDCGSMVEAELTHNGICAVGHYVHCGWGHELTIEGFISDDAAELVAKLEAKLENLIGGAETVLEAWDHHMRDVVVPASLHDAIEELRADVVEALTGSATVKESLTTEDEKQSHEWKCPIDYPGCRKNCGSYGCGN